MEFSANIVLRFEYSDVGDTGYVYFTPIRRGDISHSCQDRHEGAGPIVLQFDDGDRLLGIEINQISKILTPDLLRQIRTDSQNKPAESTHKLVIPEPTFFYSQQDEDVFFQTIACIPEVVAIEAYPRESVSEHNQITLSLRQEFLDDESLRTLLGLLMRYQLPMSFLASQYTPHNRRWFKQPEAYWYDAVWPTS